MVKKWSKLELIFKCIRDSCKNDIDIFLIQDRIFYTIKAIISVILDWEINWNYEEWVTVAHLDGRQLSGIDCCAADIMGPAFDWTEITVKHGFRLGYTIMENSSY